ncbi:MAG: AAA family ATPase [Candidatus Bathyarchaeota archaeon]
MKVKKDEYYLEEVSKKPLLKEVILENFMSYEYARIPLKPGLNIICGPNGSGKSSLLVALSVVLGQTYTERSKKLSDLVRWGEKQARITLVFDNSKVNGRRPIKGSNSDLFLVSKILRTDGFYWYEVDYHEVNKAEIVKTFSSLGINPSNMLIIMHQNMIEEFSFTPPNKKLVMVEEAVGFQMYRQRVLEAHERLNKILSEESEVLRLLSNAEQTLKYWKEQYSLLIKKRELLERKNYLNAEVVWSYVFKVQNELQRLNNSLKDKKDEVEKIENSIKEVKDKIEEKIVNIAKLKDERKNFFYKILELEKKEGQIEAYLKFKEFLNKLGDVNSGFLPKFQKFLLEFEDEYKRITGEFDDVKKIKDNLLQKISKLDEEMDTRQREILHNKIKEATLDFQKNILEKEIKKLSLDISQLEKEFQQYFIKADSLGLKVETKRTPQEVSEDLKIVNLQLEPLKDIPDEAELMFEKYFKVFEELKEKSVIVAENKRRMLAEVEVRKQTWKTVIIRFLEDLNKSFNVTLQSIGATGSIKLVEDEDIESAGLEISVGFSGASPKVLDAYTQSGGERSTIVMAFLLSLQKYVKSPIRAVDEFEVHMDPRNREVVSKLIASTVKSQKNMQYIVITPGLLPIFDEDVNIIVVQNVGGKSNIKLLV